MCIDPTFGFGCDYHGQYTASIAQLPVSPVKSHLCDSFHVRLVVRIDWIPQRLPGCGLPHREHRLNRIVRLTWKPTARPKVAPLTIQAVRFQPPRQSWSDEGRRSPSCGTSSSSQPVAMADWSSSEARPASARPAWREIWSLPRLTAASASSPDPATTSPTLRLTARGSTCSRVAGTHLGFLHHPLPSMEVAWQR